MSILILPPRFTPDTISLANAASRQQWQVERLTSWKIPPELRNVDAAVYGEPLFVSVVAEPLGIEVLEPSPNWLPNLPERYRKRTVRLATLGEARKVTSSTFIKPAADKCFQAKVYASGGDLPPPPTDLGDSELVLISEPVKWEIEFRAFVNERSVVTMSPYFRWSQLIQQSDGSWPASDEEFASAA